MVRSLRSVKKNEMATRGDNATIIPPYYLRYSTRESAKPQFRENNPKQNVNIKALTKTTDNWSNEKCMYYYSYCLAGILGISFCIILVSMLFPYPLSASCTVKWKFDETCTYVMQKFRLQIMDWSSWNVCQQRADNCLYMLEISAEKNVIRATHMAFNSKMQEKIEIVFEEVNNTCLATANSVSNRWFMIFDYGTNYCNLRNLLVGAGLDRSSKFLEVTSDAVCTQFNMAACG